MTPLATKLDASLTVLKSKVLVICPWYKSVCPPTAFCVAQLTDKRRTASAIQFGDAYIQHTRNSCTDTFLETGLEWSLWIDDDCVCPFGNAQWYNAFTGWNLPEPFASFNTIDRLLSHNKSFVGGLYFGRSSPNANPVYGEGHRERDYALKAPMEVLKPTRWIGFGCVMVHRSVFEDIEKRFPLLARGPNKRGGQWFSSSEHTAQDWILRTKNMLSVGPMDGPKAMKAYEMLVQAEADAKAHSSLGQGEDVTFALRAKQSGHTCFLDMGLLCGHVGSVVYPLRA